MEREECAGNKKKNYTFQNPFKKLAYQINKRKFKVETVTRSRTAKKNLIQLMYLL